MRRKPWSEEEVTAARTLWDKFRNSNDADAAVNLAALLSHGHEHAVESDLLIALSGSDNRKKRYSSFNIKKRKGGYRVIDVPEPSLRWIQSCIHHALSYLFYPHKCAHGFVGQRGIRTHAKIHSGHRWVFIIDILNFFPSIHWGRVFGMFQAKPFEASVPAARLLANLTTYEQRLPQGAPTSPLLSNILCRKLDHILLTWARSKGYYYSRYADDIAFSTNRQEFPQADQTQIEELIIGEGFQINDSKRRLVPRSRRQVVTGLVVNNSRPNVKRESVKNLRALLRNVIRHGWETQVNRKICLLDVNKYQDYRAKRLPLREVKEILAKQKKENLIISPFIASSHASDVLTFQKVVQGKLAFIEQIKGRDSKSYQRLRELANQAFRGTLTGIVNDLYAEQFYQAEAKYRDFKRRVMSEDTVAGLRSLLNSQQEESVAEFSWLLPPGDAADARRLAKIKEAILTTKFSSLRSPKYTAMFFGYFRNDDYFKPLLHSPDSSTESFDVLLIRCKEIFNMHKKRLPNHLQIIVSAFIKRCELSARKYPGQYLWNVEECLKDLMSVSRTTTQAHQSRSEGVVGRRWT